MTEEMASSTTIVASEVERLSSMTEDTANLTKDVADSVHEQNKSVVQLTTEIDKVEHIANDLNARMNNLKLDD
jgi:methyl-accepting chemotaxis protein